MILTRYCFFSETHIKPGLFRYLLSMDFSISHGPQKKTSGRQYIRNTWTKTFQKNNKSRQSPVTVNN